MEKVLYAGFWVGEWGEVVVCSVWERRVNEIEEEDIGGGGGGLGRDYRAERRVA